MKVLIISNLYPSRNCPYYGSFVKNFIDELRTYLPNTQINSCLLKGKSKYMIGKIVKYIIFYLKIFYCLLFFKYDYIYVHLITHSSLPILLVSKFKKLNLVFNIHGQDLLVTTALAEKLLILAKPLLYRALYIVVPSRYFKSITLRKLPNIDESKIIVSASAGVDKSFYQKQHNTNPIPVIGYVSRIDNGKGWDTLVKSARILLDRGINVSYRIVGGGKEVLQLKQLIRNLGLDNIVDYLGPQKYSELPKVFSSFDLFVFPTKLEESLGLVGLEAMASGIPVVGSRIGGITDYLIDEVNGFFFKPGDEIELADKIEQYISLSVQKKKSMSQQAQSMALKYKDAIVANHLFEQIFSH